MRRSLIALTVFASSALLLGCEDGPNQPYSPAPGNAGDRWNDGQTPPSVDSATQGFGLDAGGGNNKQLICTGAQTAARWAVMVKQPIKPPRFGAGLDLAGGDTWPGLLIQDAEKINCQSDNEGDEFGDGSQVNQWGDNGEVWVDYSVTTRKINFMTFWPGYVGTIALNSRDGKHTFTIPIYSQIQKDSKPYTIDWNDPVKFNTEINEIYDAEIFTFSPGLPQDPDCQTSGNCIRDNFGDQALIGVNPLGTYLWVDNSNAAQPTASTFTRIDMYLVKTLPFSLAPPFLKMDAEGPIAHAGVLGKAAAPCDIKMGSTYSDFLTNCVKNSGDATADTTEYNKLVGGISHDDERYSFDVVGVDVNFAAGNLPKNDVIHDQDLPAPTDVAAQFDVDQNLLGVIANDHVGNDGTAARDLHGAGLVYLEYARLVQDTLNTLNTGTKYQLGAPECTTDIDPNNPVYPPGCTGFEGFVTAAPPGFGFDSISLGAAATTVDKNLALGLKAGHPVIDFCTDINPTGDLTKGYQNCVEGDLFKGGFLQVQAVFGGGNLANLPVDIQDVRFFWKEYVTALLKYFVVANNSPLPTPTDVHNAVIDDNNLFFDSIGAGQFELAEFVDRRFTTATQPPTDIQVGADVRNGIFNNYTFSRGLYRGETALYGAMLDPTLAMKAPPADPYILGAQDTATLTNMFGSPVLATGWTASAQGKSAYYCATNLDLINCPGQTPPLDGNGDVLLNNVGQPILTPYEGAFAGGQTPFTLGQTAITITATYPAIQSAMINVPAHLNPYDQKSKLLTPINVLIPWVPAQPGEGFPISLSGTIDKFVETASLDFSGTTITANVDYAIDPTTNAVNILAVETTDFLGEVFICQDTDTGDLLSARMYTPVADILTWFSTHPSAYSDCGIIIRYSPYGNFADYISSITNGVRLGITQGGGFGRVVDATLFVPGQ